jgi:hypothetical protein
MKNTLIVFCVLVFSGSFAQKSTLHIPANQSVEIDYPDYDYYTASISNGSGKSVYVTVVSKLNDAQIRGFGIGPKGKEEVMVEKANKLIIQNENETEIKVAIGITESGPMPEMPEKQYVSFTLRNKSMESIPLIIPSVMNPNLSPDSKSGVKLKVGQEIYFKQGGRKHLLLKVDNTIKNGQEIEVSSLVKQRKEELGLK